MEELRINNQRQTIQGVPIANKQLFLNIRTVVEAEHLEGWNPTQDNIRDLIKAGNDYKAIAEVRRRLVK